MNKIKRLFPEMNIDTIKDGRGGIFTYYPDNPIVEFNMNVIKAGKVRGHHNHPEFDEYFLLVEGEGVMQTKQNNYYMSKGSCIHTPKGNTHVFYAITNCTAIAMLTKKWNDCKKPIIQEQLKQR